MQIQNVLLVNCRPNFYSHLLRDILYIYELHIMQQIFLWITLMFCNRIAVSSSVLFWCLSEIEAQHMHTKCFADSLIFQQELMCVLYLLNSSLTTKNRYWTHRDCASLEISDAKFYNLFLLIFKRFVIEIIVKEENELRQLILQWFFISRRVHQANFSLNKLMRSPEVFGSYLLG